VGSNPTGGIDTYLDGSALRRRYKAARGEMPRLVGGDLALVTNPACALADRREREACACACPH
jgi:hypothetical protein